MYFAWEGLVQMGILSRMVTQDEINNFKTLSDIPLNDNHKLVSFP
jgi:hypothetical protein